MSLEDIVRGISLVDVHTHIDFRNPTASDPSQIMLYHYIATELRSVGIPVEEVRAKSRDPVGDLIGYFKLIRNTATYWCLKRILSDLYGFDRDPNVDNWPKLKECITANFSNPVWARRVWERTGIDKIFLTINPLTEAKPEFDKKMYVASLRLDPLVGGLSKESIDQLEKISGCSASSLDRFRDLLTDRFKTFNGSAVTAAISFQSFENYRLTYSALADEAYAKLYLGKPLSGLERVHLRSVALSIVLDLCREYKLPIQIMVGVVRDIPGASPPDLAICFKQKGLLSLCRFFHQYRDVDFHLISAYRFQSHELTIIAKNYPNVYLTGYWWYCFFPESILQHILERLQLIPMGKTCGFFSDAYVLEWIYGKAALTRKMIAEALDYMVGRGFYTRSLAEEIAISLLSGNAKRLFKL
ncbi:MAG: amidohydrolase [Candidatus Bathyarchaeota archaeon]|nr:amidohydrolase [Candidatus Bathyarchaeota archaeon]